MSADPIPVVATPAAAPQTAKKSRLLSLDNRYLAPLLITCILAVGHLTYGIIEIHSSPVLTKLTAGLLTSYSPTFVAILSALGMELILGRLMVGRWPHLASAYITGISVGILIRSPELWPYVLCSAISIASKYALRIRGRHLWNPSNLGVSLMLFLAPASVTSLSLQWGNEIWPMIVIWCLGSMILYRLGRLHIAATYAAAFAVLALVRSWATGDSWLAEVAPITGPMYQLFIFFMITDPKTTTRAKWSQCAVALLVAVVEMIFRLNQVVHAPYYALFLVGPITNLVEIWWDSRSQFR
jgi:Na+-transporting NADH:ubiquinone oxidoreductase subunit NqrB